jgi:hypothetical protein
MTRREYLTAMAYSLTPSFRAAPLQVPGLVAFWDFQQPAGEARLSQGPHRYALQESAGPVQRVEGGVFGPYAARLGPGQWLSARRATVPALDLHGPDAQVSVVAWLKREHKAKPTECEAVAGMWLETGKCRQYCLFLNLRIFNSADQVCGHVSSIGGPTPGHPWCMDASIGQTAVPFDQWQCAAFSYDGQFARSYLNGRLDTRPDRNPYPYPGGLFAAGDNGADFTVGAVHRSGEMGNFFQGLLGGLAVFSRALTAQEMESLSK